MGTKIWLLFSYGLAVWLLSACCRSETYYVDQEVKDFTVFPVGSWWVYVDSVSGQRDWVVMTGISQGVFDGPADPRCVDRFESYGIGYEYYWRDSSSSYVKYEYNLPFDKQPAFNMIQYIEATEQGTDAFPISYSRKSGWLYSSVYDTTMNDGSKRMVLSLVNDIQDKYVSGIGLVEFRSPNRYPNQPRYVLENYHIN